MNGYLALIQLTYSDGKKEGFGVEKSCTDDLEVVAKSLLRHKTEATRAIVYDNQLSHVGTYYKQIHGTFRRI